MDYLADSVMEPHLARLTDTYARALLDNVPADDRADEIAGELDAVVALLDEVDDFETLLTRAVLSKSHRSELVRRIFSGRVSEPLDAFLEVLSDRDRLVLLRPSAARFHKLLNDRKGLLEVHVTTVSPLDDSQRPGVVESISEALGSEVVLIEHLDPDILGGLQVRIGDRVFDASVSVSLQKLARRLTRKIALASLRPPAGGEMPR